MTRHRIVSDDTPHVQEARELPVRRALAWVLGLSAGMWGVMTALAYLMTSVGLLAMLSALFWVLVVGVGGWEAINAVLSSRRRRAVDCTDREE